MAPKATKKTMAMKAMKRPAAASSSSGSSAPSTTSCQISCSGSSDYDAPAPKVRTKDAVKLALEMGVELPRPGFPDSDQEEDNDVFQQFFIKSSGEFIWSKFKKYLLDNNVQLPTDVDWRRCRYVPDVDGQCIFVEVPRGLKKTMKAMKKNAMKKKRSAMKKKTSLKAMKAKSALNASLIKHAKQMPDMTPDSDSESQIKYADKPGPMPMMMGPRGNMMIGPVDQIDHKPKTVVPAPWGVKLAKAKAKAKVGKGKGTL